MNIPQLDFKACEKKAKNMSIESLQYSINDCKEAIKAFPENPKANYYQDEIHVYSAELRKRIKK